LSQCVARRHVKALESRSQLLDAALASADEANRRWEECRALVDQLRIENAALRATLSNMQMQQGVVVVAAPRTTTVRMQR
jgi:coenzyme F420-reducing hydrogenase alpha subunit